MIAQDIMKETVMKILQKGISISLLALFGTMHAFAAPEGRQADRDGRDSYQAPRQTERNDQQLERRASPSSEAQGKHKMTPEERRTLRQQINEANQDIHPRKR